MGPNDAGYPPRAIHPLIRWAAFTGIALLIVRRLIHWTFPNALPSSAWRPKLWGVGLLADAVFDLVLLVLLLGVPFCIYYFRHCTGQRTARDLLIDCGAAAGLYITTLLLL